ncbi:helix-turn-helix transcriptional regulator [Bradyrhizobium sp. UFLA 03-164]|uniref:Helix-turn-helix transcriptional regulator n=1 Tax=Bradyrhizobium uaiense TaxID=2594946 RepID=A0A6P1BAY9_9BRAD|nr:helix-turn-helix transcriptional regulator [Bradyrhizobium uaiense]
MRYVIDKPFHSLFFYLPRSALDDIARQAGAPRIGELAYEPGIGHDDAVVRNLGASLVEALRRADEANQLFVDHMLHALTAHIAQTYGGLPRSAKPIRGGLAPWQLDRACDRLNADLAGKTPLRQIAAEFDLSVDHFSRAFRISTGLPPHRWLLRRRVKTAEQLMTIRDLPLSEVAKSAGFANQSHFTRVFSAMVGVSPGAWRRGVRGTSDSEA